MLAQIDHATPVSLVFTMGWDPLQLLINTSTQSVAAHVALGLGEKGEYLLHAYEPGIVLEPRQQYLDRQKQNLVAEYRILPDVREGLAGALAQVGKRGFFPGMAQIALIRALRITGSPLAGLIPSNERTCARFAMSIDRKGACIPEWRRIHRSSVSPGDLLAAAQEGSSFSRVHP